MFQTREAERNEDAHDLPIIVTDSESDDLEDWVPIQGAENAKEIKKKLKKQRAIASRHKKRLIAKEISNKRLLKHHLPQRVSRTLKKYSDIMTDTEMLARENGVGADSWRRTGLLTFNGNSKTAQSLHIGGYRNLSKRSIKLNLAMAQLYSSLVRRTSAFCHKKDTGVQRK